MKKLLAMLLAALMLVCVGTAALADASITFQMGGEPECMDPTINDYSSGSYALQSLFRGLYKYDADGALVPAMAESYEVSEDGCTYTFKLKEGLKWSDGSPLTAHDFEYSWKRVLNPEVGSETAYTLYGVIKDGYECFVNKTVSVDDLPIRALDDTTFQVELKAPASYFLTLTASTAFMPVSQANVEKYGEDWANSPETYVCNGPFKITEMNMGENVVLEKNENYWNAENVTLDKINYRYILDTSTALTAYESGEVDGVRSIPSSDYARLKAENAGVQIEASYGTVYYDFNCAKEPFNNPLVRKALCLAIDREALINNVAQVEAQPAYSFLAPGYVVDGKDITEGRSDYGLSSTADVEGAKAALEEAGYPNGEGFPTVQLSFYSDDNVKKIAEAIAEMWQTNLGIQVEVTSSDWAVFYDAVQAGEYDVAAMGWSADYVNPMSFLPLLYTDDVSNNVFYSNKDYDAVVDQIKVEKDSTKFAELVMQADEIASNEYPVLPLYYKSNNYLLKDYVKGVYMTSSSNIYFKDAQVLAH